MGDSQPTAFIATTKQLKQVIADGEQLLKEKAYYESVLEGKKRDFINRREAGITGELANGIIPTIQDLAIYSFWVSYALLFYLVGTSRAFLEGKGRYFFIAATLGAFVVGFFSWQVAALIVICALLYFVLSSTKSMLFFLVFLITSVFIHSMIGRYF